MFSIGLFGHTDAEFTTAFDAIAHPDMRIRYDLKLYWLIDEQIGTGAHTFISGLRDGVDTLLASYVLDCRRITPEKEIKLHVVLAYPEQANASPAKRAILEQADSSECIGRTAAPSAFQQQTQRMVNLSTRVLAVYFGAEREYACAFAKARAIQVHEHSPRGIIRTILNAPLM